MKIDKFNRRILFELDKNARISERKLAKIIGRSKESVRYRISRMVEEGIISRFTIWIDPTKLGYQSAKMYLTLANIPEKKEEFKKYILNDKRLFWLGMAEGAFNAGITFFVKSNQEFFSLKNEIFTEFKDLIIDSYTASLVSVHYYNSTYIYPGENKEEILFSKPDNMEIDGVSIRILKELFQDSRTTLVRLAKKCKASVEIVKSRIRKMEEQKIIVRYTVAVDYAKLDMDYYKAFLYFKNLTGHDLGRLMQYCFNIPNIRFIVKQISPWDIELEMFCKNYKKYNNIISRINTEFSNIIKKVETSVVSEDYIFPGKEIIFDG